MKFRLGLLVILVLALTLAAFSSSSADAPFCNITSRTKYMFEGDTYYVSWKSGKTTQVEWAAIMIPVGPRSSVSPGGWAVYTLTVDPQDLVDRTGSYDAWTTIDLPAGQYGNVEFAVAFAGGVYCKAELSRFVIDTP